MIRVFFRTLLYWPYWFTFVLLGNKQTHEELHEWSKALRVDYGSEYKNFMFLFGMPEYRSVLYWRLGIKAILAKKITPPHRVLYLTTPSKNVGTGLVIQHGHSTIINATSIGSCCQIWQNVTIGKERPGGSKPIIGNNVLICAGAVVLGKITIGDNVVIGANAVVIKSVPCNCTVVGNPARIIRENGIRVEKVL